MLRAGVVGARAARTDEQLRYGTPGVEQASAWVRWLLQRDPTTGFPVAPISGGLTAITILRSAPTRRIELSPSPSGALIDTYLRARTRGIRSHLYAQSVLTVPALDAPLLHGRRFQAVRTNTARARRDGITCRELPASERPRVLQELNEPVLLLQRTIDRWWVAELPDGRAVGLALATVDHAWAMLNILVAEGYTARYLLHTHMVSAIRDAHVRYILHRGPSALALPPGLQYLQARLGYEIVNLRLSSPDQSDDAARAGPLARCARPGTHR